MNVYNVYLRLINERQYDVVENSHLTN